MTSDLHSRAAGLALGFAADRAFADPAHWHPVAGFGAVAQGVERALNRPGAAPARARAAGVVYVAGMVGGAASLGVVSGWLADCGLRRHPAGRFAVDVVFTAAATWVSLGGTSLLRVAGTIGDAMAAGDVDGAREWLPWLCGREPYQLDPQELARATVESVAENTADAHVAPVVWGAVAGAPGILAYRAANTLDAMVGHRSERFENFGWAAARLDDALNWIPARLAGLATVAAAPSVGGRMRDAVGAWKRDAHGHPSPNAGVVESTAAGALGVELGGRTPYAYGVEFRGRLNAGAALVQAADISRALALERRVQDGTVVAAVLGLLVAGVAGRIATN